MINEFEMIDIGLMTYYLGIEIKQGDDGIFISQDKFIKEILKKFKKKDCAKKKKNSSWVWSEDDREWWRGEYKLYNIQKPSWEFEIIDMHSFIYCFWSRTWK